MDTFPEADKRWLMHLGYLAQTWAALEQSLDGIARQLHAGYDTKKTEPIPISFGRKRNYIRSQFAKHANLVEFSGTVNEILDAATSLSELRNWALHSGMAGVEDSVRFSRWRKADFAHENRELSLQEVYDAALGCAALTIRLGILARYFFRFQTREETEQLIGEITGQLGAALPGDEPAG